MNVLVSAVSGATGISGVQRHAINLVRSLAMCDELDEVHVVVGPWQEAMQREMDTLVGPRVQLHLADLAAGALSRNVWHYRGLPELAARLLVDLVHFTYPVPINAAGLICRSVVTLHDLYPYQIPGNFGLPKVLLNRWILRQCLHAADGIACVSEHTFAEMAYHMEAGVRAKAVRIHNCVEPFHAETAACNEVTRKPFLLCVAQHRRNKNLLFLVRVFKELRMRSLIGEDAELLIVGMPGPETRSLRRLIDRLGLSERVKLLSSLSNEQLQWCFARCRALLAPSLTEGFGLPVVEGMLAGCRVVCSDIPAFHEFGEGYCEFVQIAGELRVSRFADAVERSLAQVRPTPLCFPTLEPGVIGREYVALYKSVVNRHWVCAEERYPVRPISETAERRVL